MNAHARKRWACRLKNLALALDPFEFALAPTVCSVGVAVDVASELFLGRLADVVPKTDVAFERREDIALAPCSPNRLLSLGPLPHELNHRRGMVLHAWANHARAAAIMVLITDAAAFSLAPAAALTAKALGA
jgi:hypothetical protein